MASRGLLLYASPWGEPLPRADRVEYVEYGPSVSTFARHLAAWRQWAWRPPVVERARADAVAVEHYMRPDGVALRGDVPRGERQVYLLLYEHGHSVRWVARTLGLQRATVNSYRRRLQARVRRAEEKA